MMDSEYSNTRAHRSLYQKFKLFLLREKLMVCIIVAVILGLLVGLLINRTMATVSEPKRSDILILIGFPGEILMRILKMLVLPLITTSLIVGLAELDQTSSGKLGRRAIIYYFCTTIFSVLLGIILAIVIKPGKNVNVPYIQKTNFGKTRTMDALLDLVRNMFPENIVQASLEQYVTPSRILQTGQINSTMAYSANKTTYNSTAQVVTVAGSGIYTHGTNILGVVIFSIAVGISLGKLGARGKDFVCWISTLNDVIITLVNFVMWYSPIGILSLIIKEFASMVNLETTFASLGLYLMTVTTGLIVHSCLVLPLIYFVTTRRNPFHVFKGIIKALFTAFGTSSSSATLPVTFSCLEENLKLDKRITRFIVPIGATINMDGTALYEAVAAIYIAQAVSNSLTVGQYVGISLTSTLASIGAAGIPQAGLITLLIVLQTVGLPEEAITLILSVDWFLDRTRTTVNVLGDCFGACIINHLSVKDLEQVNVLKTFNNEVENLELGIRNQSFVQSFENLNNNNQNW